MIIFFDFETTGLVLPSIADTSNQPRAIELAMIKTDDELNVLDKWEAMFNPKEFITPEITKITGITNAMAQNHRPFAASYKDICEFMLGCKTIIAHNLGFDIAILHYELMRIGKATSFPYPYHQVCTAQLTEQMFGKRMTLKATHELIFGEKYNQIHRAMDDTELLLKTYKGMLTYEPAKTED